MRDRSVTHQLLSQANRFEDTVLNCFSVGSPCRLLFFKNHCSRVLLHGVESFRKRQFQHGFPMGCSSFQASCSNVALSMGCTVDVCSDMVLQGLKRDNVLNHILLHRLQENLCSSG